MEFDIKHDSEPSAQLRTGRNAVKVRRCNFHILDIDRKGKWVKVDMEGTEAILRKKDSAHFTFRVTFDDRDF